MLKNNLFLNNNLRKVRGNNGSKLKKSDATSAAAHHQNIVFSTQPNHRHKHNFFKNHIMQLESPGNPGKGI